MTGIESKIDELKTEPKPQNPPDGYFDPANPGATEPQPTSPPDGYVANTEANASAIEEEAIIKEAEAQDNARVEVLHKYASAADNLLAEEYGDDYDEKNTKSEVRILRSRK